MKKLFCVLFLLLAMSASSFAESEREAKEALIHEMFANYSDEELLNLRTCVEFEIEYRSKAKPDDDSTQDMILSCFERNGLKIKRVMFQPLVEKDPGGLYGGKERWFVTLESGEQIGTWVSDGKITFCYGNQWYNDVPLY